MEQNFLHKTQKSFSDLYAVYFTKMLRFSTAYVGREEDAENIVQDIFLYLWEHADLLETVGNRDAFLFTLVKNRCLNFLKHRLYVETCKQSLEQARTWELQMNLYSLQQFDESSLSLEEMEVLLHKAIDALPERCRQIFVLSRMEGLKYKEIAERLDISVNTVENQISIALKKLKGELKEYLPLLIFLFS